MRRRTVRLRLTLIYGVLFLVTGAALLGITYVLVANQSGAQSVSFRATGGPAVGVFSVSGQVDKLPPPTKNLKVVSQDAPPGTQPSPKALRTLQTRADKALHDQRSHTLATLLELSGVALAAMGLLSILVGWWMAGRVLRPLRTMTTRARRISEDNLHERLALDGPADELKELGDTIDGLLARLESAFEAQRRFVANASHELRTPLTLERAMIEVALRDPSATASDLRAVCERVLVAGEQQERLIEALLTLARSQRGLDRREPVDLARVAGEALPSGGSPRVDAALRPAVLLGDRRLVERLVANLVENAARHNVPGGWISVTTSNGGPDAVLRVVNSGPRVAEDEVSGLLEPFRRAGAARATHGEGLGLGLSIAAAVVAAHGAALELRARPEGGLEVEVRFAALQGVQIASNVTGFSGSSQHPAITASLTR